MLQSNHHGDATLLTAASLTSPGPSPSSFTNNTDVDSYFDLHPDGGARSPTSLRSAAVSSIDLLAGPATTLAALTALQYLPMPVLVLNSAKNVVMGNEAMGRLLGIDPSELENDDGPVATVTDVLQGQHMSNLGVEILAHGSPILISWEVSTCSWWRSWQKAKNNAGFPRRDCKF
jgi:hypothetical protein